MRCFFLVFWLALYCSPAFSQPDDRTKKDEERIQGTWMVLGDKSKNQTWLDSTLFVFRTTDFGNGIALKTRAMGGAGALFPEGYVALRFTDFKLDATKSPKEIDLTMEDFGGRPDVLHRGIYEIDDHTLQIHVASPRPKDFESTEDNLFLLLLMRTRPAISEKPVKAAASSSPAATPNPGKAQNWPTITAELTGTMEVRIKNPNGFKVKVGLRSNGKGKDFTVAENATQSVSVPNGRYDIYFQYSTDPDGLYQGDSFTLKDNGVEIQIVKVVDGNYGIKQLK